MVLRFALLIFRFIIIYYNKGLQKKNVFIRLSYSFQYFTGMIGTAYQRG